ncbi:MAG: glutamine-hydrolyzing GMP synthase [Candidatus Ranarchaeia archaeon]
MISSITPKHITEETAEDFIKKKIKEIQDQVEKGKAICATSGGVDSTTAAVLAAKALGPRVRLIYIDTGLMRMDEGTVIEKALAKLGIKIECIDATDAMFNALKGIVDPEKKRKTFRKVFYSIFGQEIKRWGASHLIQGTIYPDIIESTRIKTQHNVLEQIGLDPLTTFGFRVIEPLKQLYKDQVRILARHLGLPPEFSERQPFPGPGLAVRILGEVTREKADLLRQVTVIVEHEMRRYTPSQYFAVLMSHPVTGVKGDERVLGQVVAIRAVSTRDFMTADIIEVPWEHLKRIADLITRKLPSIVKVLYDVTSKPPSTIEYE